ncbi:GNAT family N-acetyltransferase [Chitinophaga lutea]
MLKEYESLELVNAHHRFELTVNGHTAFIVYKQAPGKITLIHTDVPAELEGKGVGQAIVEKTLHYIEDNGLKLIPLCPFVVAYLKRHPEWKRILADEVTNI